MSRWARSAGRPDQNNQDIADKARACGASVTITTGVGHDFPDQVWGFGADPANGIAGVTILVEVKRPGKKLEPGQDDFRKNWRGGPVVCVRTADDVVKVLHGADMRALMRREAERAKAETHLVEADAAPIREGQQGDDLFHHPV